MHKWYGPLGCQFLGEIKSVLDILHGLYWESGQLTLLYRYDFQPTCIYNESKYYFSKLSTINLANQSAVLLFISVYET